MRVVTTLRGAKLAPDFELSSTKGRGTFNAEDRQHV
jgi:hypothetical protein